MINSHSVELSPSAQSYNALHSVAEANRALARKGEEEIVGELLNVIATAGLADRFGIRLLHKHNDLESGQIMAEFSSQDDEGYALVTAVRPATGLSNCRPNSWQRTPSGFQPVEFSERNLIAEEGETSRVGALFQRLAELIDKYDVADLLGPSLNYSSDVMGHAPMSDAALLEKTDEENVENVCRFVSRVDVAFTNSAKTKWHARRVVTDDGRITWMTACNCFCSVSENGGHLGTKTHRYNPKAEGRADEVTSYAAL